MVAFGISYSIQTGCFGFPSFRGYSSSIFVFCFAHYLSTHLKISQNPRFNLKSAGERSFHFAARLFGTGFQAAIVTSLRLKKKKKKNPMSQSCRAHLFFAARLIQQNSRFEFFFFFFFFACLIFFQCFMNLLVKIYKKRYDRREVKKINPMSQSCRVHLFFTARLIQQNSRFEFFFFFFFFFLLA